MKFRPLIKPIKKYQNIGFDIETFGNENKFLMGSLFFNDDFIMTFDNKPDFYSFLLTQNWLNKRIFAHNLQFDFLGLFFGTEHFDGFRIFQRGSDFIAAKSNISGNKFNYSRIPGNRNKIVYCDTANFYKASLEKIGKIINIPKMQKPDFLGQKPKTKSDYEYLREYNINDARITKNFADFLQDSFNALGAEMKYTIASSSMDLFKRKYLKADLWAPGIDDIKAMYKPYYGGRCEILDRGHTTEHFNVYDFNSLYPSVMKSGIFPHPNYLRRSYRPEMHIIKDYEGFCYAEMEYFIKDKIAYMPLKINSRLCFPKGIIKGHYTFFKLIA